MSSTGERGKGQRQASDSDEAEQAGRPGSARRSESTRDDLELEEGPLMDDTYLRRSYSRVKSFGDFTIESMRSSSPVPLPQLLAIWYGTLYPSYPYTPPGTRLCCDPVTHPYLCLIFGPPLLPHCSLQPDTAHSGDANNAPIHNRCLHRKCLTLFAARQAGCHNIPAPLYMRTDITRDHS